MKWLRKLIKDVLRVFPDLEKEQLHDAVMVKVKKEGFFTEDELTGIEEELSDRLKHY